MTQQSLHKLGGNSQPCRWGLILQGMAANSESLSQPSGSGTLGFIKEKTLKEYFHKGIFLDRAFRVFLWYSLANLIVFPLACGYMVLFEDYWGTCVQTFLWAFTIGLPMVVLKLISPP